MTARAAASAGRRERPASDTLRRDVRLLTTMLGDAIAESGGAALLDRGRGAPPGDHRVPRRAEPRPAGGDVSLVDRRLDAARAEDVIRAFTCYFQLVNLAEERERVRLLSRRDRSGKPVKDSIAALDVDPSALSRSAHHPGADRPPHRGEAARRGGAPVADRGPARPRWDELPRAPPDEAGGPSTDARGDRRACGAPSRSGGIAPSRSMRFARCSRCSTRRSS